jgi:hypothetical protein
MVGSEADGYECEFRCGDRVPCVQCYVRLPIGEADYCQGAYACRDTDACKARDIARLEAEDAAYWATCAHGGPDDSA